MGSEFLFQPRRSSAFGAPPSTAQVSTFPSGPFTSMWIQECGLLHSILMTVPLIVTGLFASNSAANEWCARIGTAAATNSAAMTENSFIRTGSLLPGLLRRLLFHVAVEQLFREFDAV